MDVRIRYVVSITQVLKDTLFGLDNWCKCVEITPRYYGQYPALAK
jgi:hypothetical protein